MKRLFTTLCFLLIIAVSCEDPLTETLITTQTGEASEVTANSAVISGVARFGPSAGDITVGVVYDTKEELTLQSSQVVNVTRVDSQNCFTVILSSLRSGTKYYYQSFLKKKSGSTEFGELKSFTTDTVPVESVSLSPEILTLTEGEVGILTATVLPEDATDKAVNWTSTKPSVVDVDQEGRVTALSAGEAVVVVTANEGGKTAFCSVTVEAAFIHISSIKFEFPSLELTEGDTATLIPMIEPEDATDKSVTWESSDESIVSVDEGLVTALSPGIATVSATTVDGGLKAMCSITVKQLIIPVKSVSLDLGELALTVGQTHQLVATVLPDNATNKAVHWSCSDEKVVSVKDGAVKAESNGEAKIIVRTEDGGFTSDCKVTVTTPVASVSLDRNTIPMTVGEAQKLIATVEPPTASNKNVVWSSDNSDIAAVDNNGTVTAISVGEAVITVTTEDGGYSAVCNILVQEKIIPVESVSLAPKDVALKVGDSPYPLTVTVFPENATNKAVNWSSSDEAVAKVEDSLVTAAGNGTAAITVTTTDGEFSDQCIVTVTTAVAGVSLNPKKLELTTGETGTLNATVEPPTASDKTVKWSSSNEIVATVSDIGEVKAISEGEAIITVMANDGGFTDECKVIVKEPEPVVVHVTSIRFESPSMELTEGDTKLLALIIEPDDATDKSVTWESSDKNIVSVDEGLVAALSPGIATVTATTVDGGLKAMCSITVKKRIIPVESVSLDLGELALTVGQAHQLVATVLPENATNKAVEWISSDNYVATVKEGLVTAVGNGVVTITVTTVDGRLKDQCEVTVYPKTVSVESVSLNKTELLLTVGASEQLYATILPQDATNQVVTWSSSNEAVAKVEDGFVTAIGNGAAIITVSTDDGGKTAVCAVTVSSASTSTEFEAIDLGLPSGTKWANMNLGASKPEEYGHYFAWGEKEPKADYSWATYKWCNGSEHSFNKYNSSPDYGAVDYKLVLDLEDDAAYNSLGQDWHTPSSNQVKELLNNCTVKYSSLNGVQGRSLTSKINGKSLFFPAAGVKEGTKLNHETAYGFYMINERESWGGGCLEDYFSVSQYQSTSGRTRAAGHTIRPVQGDNDMRVSVESVSLNRESIELNVGESFELIQTVYPSNASNKNVLWSSSDKEIAKVSTGNNHGIVNALKAGTAEITVITVDKGEMAKCEITVVDSNTQTSFTAVDLGLPSGVKWANMNLGASAPEEYGYYYAWGEVSSKKNYNWSSYLWGSSLTELTKYSTLLGYGSVDNIYVIVPEDDAATAALRGLWRLPTKEELTELMDPANCNWVRIQGEDYYTVSSKHLST